MNKHDKTQISFVENILCLNFSKYDSETMCTEGIKFNNRILLSATHKGKVGSCIMGSYGALVSFNKVKDSALSEEGSGEQSEPTEEVAVNMAVVGQQLCQHIVGMNPQSLGNPDAEGKERTKTLSYFIRSS